MKSSHILSILLILAIITIFIQGSKIENLKSEIKALPNMVIPKDYKTITHEDILYGWYANDTLYIDYDNQAYYPNIQ